jgi:hypothetical protein
VSALPERAARVLALGSQATTERELVTLAEVASPDEMADAQELLDLSIHIERDYQRLLLLRLAYLQAEWPQLDDDR